MANKKKNSLALFEAISQSRAKRSNPNLNIPSWAAASEPMPAPPPTAPASPTAAAAPTVAAPVAAPVPPAPAPAPVMTAPPPEKRVAFPAASTEPVVATAGDRLKLNLTYRISVAVAAALILLVVGAFALGKYLNRNNTVTPAAVGDLAGGADTKKEAVGGNEKKDVPPVVVKPERLKGKYYLVIQAFTANTAKDMQEARRIVEFCNETGEPADVAIFNNRRTGKPFVAVWSLTPYDTNDASDTEKARKQAEIVESIGKKYFGKYQTYKFQQMRDAKSRIVPWLVKYE